MLSTEAFLAALGVILFSVAALSLLAWALDPNDPGVLYK